MIDFGIMGTGDPACDYAMAWTFFDSQSRKRFLQGLHSDTIDRARGWALWKALITLNASLEELFADVFMRRDRDKGGGRPEFCGEGVQISAMAGNEICALF